MTKNQKDKKEVTKLANGIVEMMRSLTGVMDYEVDLLERHDYASLNGLRQEKAKLVRDYKLTINRLSQNPDMLRNAGVDLKELLKVEGKKLDKASSRNAHELQSAITATQSLVQTIMDSARDQLTKDNVYKNTNDLSHMAGQYSPVSPAVAIDQNI